MAPIRDRDGVITHYMVIKEDISERKQAEESLRRSEMHLRTIMDNVVEGIVTVNQRGIIESINPAVERMFGYRSEELLGHNVKILVPEPHQSRHDAYIEALLADGSRGSGFFNREIVVFRRDGVAFPMELTISDVCSGKTVQFIATMRDISGRKQAEIELEAARQNAFHQEKMAAIGTLAAGIVHEIGNPIAALTGLVEELTESCRMVAAPSPESAVDLENSGLLSMIQEQIRRLSTIIRDVSTLSLSGRSSRGMPQADDFQLLDLNSLIEGTVRLMRFDQRMRRVRCTMVLDRNLPAVFGSDHQIRQVLLNLLINAADAMEGGAGNNSELTISSSAEADLVRVTVADNGMGMDPETLAHATEAFFTTKPIGKGSGLGLSLCYAIMQAHGGSLVIESTPQVGSKVHMLLALQGHLGPKEEER